MAAHELYLLHLGKLGVRDDAGQVHWGQVPGYLIRTAGGRTILIDQDAVVRYADQHKLVIVALEASRD